MIMPALVRARFIVNTQREELILGFSCRHSQQCFIASLLNKCAHIKSSGSWNLMLFVAFNVSETMPCKVCCILIVTEDTFW